MTAHFLIRCRERGLGDVAETLLADLRLALALRAQGDPRADAAIEHVFDLPTHNKMRHKAVYRFVVADVQYFAVVADGTTLLTVLTRDILADYRQKNRPPSKKRKVKILKDTHYRRRDVSLDED